MRNWFKYQYSCHGSLFSIYTKIYLTNVQLKQQSNGTAVDNGHSTPQPPSSNGQSNGGAGSNGQSNGASSGTSTQAAQPKPQAQEALAPVATALGITGTTCALRLLFRLMYTLYPREPFCRH